MESVTVWMKRPTITLYVGGSPSKGQAPVITTVVERPQVLFDYKNNTITIIETK